MSSNRNGLVFAQSIMYNKYWKQGESGLSGAVWLPESKLNEGNLASAE